MVTMFQWICCESLDIYILLDRAFSQKNIIEFSWPELIHLNISASRILSSNCQSWVRVNTSIKYKILPENNCINLHLIKMVENSINTYTWKYILKYQINIKLAFKNNRWSNQLRLIHTYMNSPIFNGRPFFS